MKKLLFIILSLTIFNASADALKLEPFDQEKLADLLGRIPLTVRNRVITPITEQAVGILVTSDFPIEDDLGFKAHCESKYFNGSNYPSSSVCTLNIDEHHPLMDTKHDELQLEMKDAAVAKALFDAISYGKPEKDFRSFGKDYGTNVTGKWTYIFHYRFKCGEAACVFNFSKIIGQGGDSLTNL